MDLNDVLDLIDLVRYKSPNNLKAILYLIKAFNCKQYKIWFCDERMSPIDEMREVFLSSISSNHELLDRLSKMKFLQTRIKFHDMPRWNFTEMTLNNYLELRPNITPSVWQYDSNNISSEVIINWLQHQLETETQDSPELDSNFFDNAILVNPGESIVDAVNKIENSN